MIDLRLINSEHPLKEETINLSSFKGIEMIDYALEALLKLLDSIDARELIFPVSGYRDRDFQKKDIRRLFKRKWFKFYSNLCRPSNA